MQRAYGELRRLGTRYKREKNSDLFTHEPGGQPGTPMDEGTDEALGFFGVRVEREGKAGAKHALDGFGIEQPF